MCGDASACVAADGECNGNNRAASVGWGWQRVAESSREWQRTADASSSAAYSAAAACLLGWVAICTRSYGPGRPRAPPPKKTR